MVLYVVHCMNRKLLKMLFESAVYLNGDGRMNTFNCKSKAIIYSLPLLIPHALPLSLYTLHMLSFLSHTCMHSQLFFINTLLSALVFIGHLICLLSKVGIEDYILPHIERKLAATFLFEFKIVLGSIFSCQVCSM